jgi:SSS family solute:Na+ symporter
MTRLVSNVFERFLDPDTLYYAIFVDINWLHYSIYLFFLCIVIVVVVSMFTKPIAPERLTSITYGAESEAEKKETRQSWNHWDVINTLIIIGITVAFYIYFW